MGSLPEGTRCGWCGRIGAGYIPDGVYVPLCGRGGIVDKGCLFGGRDFDEVMSDALSEVFCLRKNAGDGWKPQALMFLAARLAPYLGNIYHRVDEKLPWWSPGTAAARRNP